MAGWPFTNVGAPNLDTGPGQAVPTSPTAITADPCWPTGLIFMNDDPTEFRTVLVTDTAGNQVHKVTLPPGATDPQERPFEPCTGLKWGADGANVKGHIWGYA